MITDWSKYAPYFKEAEFDCKETSENDMQPEFMNALLELRKQYGKSMTITSGFRSCEHSREAKKDTPGYHTKGLAADIACDFFSANAIAKLAIAADFTVGVSQRSGLPRFIHLDLRPGTPGLYSY